MTDWIGDLDAAIAGAVTRATHSFEKFGILFSAGVDSSLIAKLCEDLGKKPTLYSVGINGCAELAQIEKANFNEIKIRAINIEEVEGYARKVIAAINSHNAMHVGIGIPLYIACEEAKKDGHKLALSGQGADELFAGYNRYLRMTQHELEKALRSDLEELLKANILRDIAIAGANSLELGVPYLDSEVVKVALSIPAELKIKDGIRKYILREVARKRGLPEFIYAREKKAVQYSTGIDKALRKIAKEKGKSIEEYLRSL
ncbi:MAG: asparagine synthase C-terminal domain-containing protein [Euryarchaeota archaeon]|nr:asparagine synthase C-terminal domain-containing protein [Euryarchaeota archaeon]